MLFDNSFDAEKYIIVQSNRIFIDICSQGCGSNCAYCYVKSKSEQQVLLPFNCIRLLCEYIEEKYSPRAYIISLCPNTEPLKSEASISLIMYISKYFLHLGNYIQISTKERIPPYFVEELDSVANGRVFINVSIPYLEQAIELEPYAAAVNDRLQNFLLARENNNVIFCLYIKPYSTMSKDTMRKYAQLIQQYDLNLVCVGVRLYSNLPAPCIALYNTTLAKRLFTQQLQDCMLFINYLRQSTHAKVFCLSVCCIHIGTKSECHLKLFNYSPSLCADCEMY